MQIELIEWYKKNGRKFIWREKTLPYEIMVAEFMLQRTKAEQVSKVYTDFITEFPTIAELSIANIEMLKKYTNKLGLPQRIEYFLEAAKYITINYNSKYPETKEELLKIPGIGDYVASVILTVCYNKQEPIIDSNIARFINRFYGLNISREIRRKNEIIKISKDLFNFEQPREFLFAILDFCFYFCKPNNPKCENCILEKKCKFLKKNK